MDGSHTAQVLMGACLAGHEAADDRPLRADEQVVQAHRPEQPVRPGQAGVAVHLTRSRSQSATPALRGSAA